MQKSIVHIAAFVSMLFWGMSYIWSKIVFEFYTPLTSIFLRLLVSFSVLFIFILLTQQWEKIKKKHYKIIFASAIFNPFLYFLGEYYGLDKVSASISAIIIATIPVFTPFVAYRIFKEKLSVVNIIGLIISFAGLLFIILNKDFSLSASPIGLALLFMAVLAAIIYSVFLKKLSSLYKPLTIIAWQNLIGALLFLPFFLIFDANEFFNIQPSNLAIVSIIMLGVFASSLAYILFAYSIKYLGISRANIYTNLIPVFAGITSYIVLDEIFQFNKLIGMCIVLIGVLLSQVDWKMFSQHLNGSNRKK